MPPNSERAESGLDGEYVPGPLQRVRKQVADYEAADDVQGGTLEGRPASTNPSLPMFGDPFPRPGRP